MVKRIAKKFSLGKLAFLTIFLTIIFLLVLFYSHILNPTSIKKTTFSSYRNNINYQVFLRNNNFISKPSLGMNQAYIASMVDSIHVSFGQTATFQKMTSFRYDYTIYAKLSAVYPTENGEEEIWSQVYPLKVQDTKSVREKMLSIADQVSISYWDYQAVVNNFKNTYHLKVDATLDIIMDVHYEYQNQEDQVKAEIETTTTEIEQLNYRIQSLRKNTSDLKSQLLSKKSEIESRSANLVQKRKNAENKAEQLKDQINLANQKIKKVDSELEELEEREKICKSLFESLQQPIPSIQRIFTMK